MHFVVACTETPLTFDLCMLPRCCGVAVHCCALQIVKAMMVFWTAGFVLFTLLINAPLLPTVLRLTGLSKVPSGPVACLLF